MALESRLELKLSQKLVLTPQLQMAIKLLQLTQLELSQTLSQELIENPFLEETLEMSSTESQSEEISHEERESLSDRESFDTAGDSVEVETPIDIDKMMSFSVDDYYDERSYDGRDLGYFTPGTVTQPSFEQFVSSAPDLYEHLLWQLRLSREDEKFRSVGEIIIGNLDDNGYLRTTTEEIAAVASVDMEMVELSLRLVQSFDPPGVAARDLRECLLLQLRPLDLEGSLVEEIISKELDAVSKKKYQQIAKTLGRSIENVMAAINIIEGLEPKPGRNFSSTVANYIAPDVYIVKASDGYQIILNDEGLPKLRISSYYKKLFDQRDSVPKEDRHFLEEKLRSAQWLMKSLSQRNRTIYRVSESILGFQKEFFDFGISTLKPLNLKDVADELSLHESTISRVTSNKYLACAQGIYSFKYFFSKAVSRDSGVLSSTSLKDIIRKIILEENHQKPLSDMDIVDILKAKNITIARRTVAKYREELKIPPHSQRKKISFVATSNLTKGGFDEYHN